MQSLCPTLPHIVFTVFAKSDRKPKNMGGTFLPPNKEAKDENIHVKPYPVKSAKGISFRAKFKIFS